MSFINKKNADISFNSKREILWEWRGILKETSFLMLARHTFAGEGKHVPLRLNYYMKVWYYKGPRRNGFSSVSKICFADDCHLFPVPFLEKSVFSTTYEVSLIYQINFVSPDLYLDRDENCIGNRSHGSNFRVKVRIFYGW